MIREALIALMLVTPAVADDNPVTQADELLRKTFPADKPGAAVAIVHKGTNVLLQGYGLADLDTKTPITGDTAFDLASVSKQFTSTAVLLLVERGRLNLDDPVVRWVPDFPAGDAITLRHLLTHTSGLPDYIGIFKGSDEEFARLTCHDIAGMLRGKKALFPPGTKFQYSNTNYALLPVVVERASGKTFAQFLRDYVFVPLGMDSTRVMDRVPYDVANRASGYGRQFLVGKHVPSRRDGPVCGDGNVFSTARDMIAWNAALEERRLLRPETWEQAWTKTPIAEGKQSDYGFGWVVSEKEGRKAVWHNGGWAGTRTLIFRRLSDKLTVIVLSNDEGANVDKVGTDVMKLFYPPEKK
ncbi:MAG: beta-lactamase family protein [Gemmataceae bacterium]|nr:beta-lactamase family protein [Gemmataceae bacterium]